MLVTVGATAQHDVLTQRNNNARTGAYLAEAQLTPSSVSSGTFGRLYSHHVDGQIAAQPLYARAVTTPGGPRNLVFIATRENFVYAFDADRPGDGAIWRAGPRPTSGAAIFGPPPPIVVEMARDCRQTRSVIGITSTPVIDRDSNTMYVVSREGIHPIYHIHAIDIRTGAPRAGANDMPIPELDGYSATVNLNRPGLLLIRGVLYLGFGAMNCDNLCNTFHGYVMAFSAASLEQLAVLNTTPGPSGNGGGVWQSGTGLAADDASANIYFFTGNGTNSKDHVQGRGVTPTPSCRASPDQPCDKKLPQPLDVPNQLSDSIVKIRLDPATRTLNVLKYFTARTWQALSSGDTDLGSGGPVLLPDGYLTGGGKEGRLYVLNQATMQPVPHPAPSNPATANDPDGLQAYWNTYDRYPDVYACSQQWAPNIHGSPVFWKDASGRQNLYAMPEKDYLRVYSYDPSSHKLAPGRVGELRSPFGMPGAQISLSANGRRDGILWVNVPKYDANLGIAPGRLVAIDAETLKELWRDDSDVAYAKFVPPTIADGKVFRATFSNELIVYGLGGTKPRPNCETTEISKKYETYAGADWLGLLRKNGDCPLRKCSYAFYDTYDSIYSNRNKTGDPISEYAAIYTSPETCAHVVRYAIETKWGDVRWRIPGKEALQWESGPLGLPITDERVGISGDHGNATDFDRLRRYNQFEHGAVYAVDPNGFYRDPKSHAFAVYNDVLPDGTTAPIYDKYKSFGGLEGVLGAPATDTLPTPDGDGRYAYFKGGTVYWSRNTGVHVVWGAIFAEWAKNSFERGKFGYPTSDEEPWAERQGGRTQSFQHGWLCWSPGTAPAFICDRRPHR
jgi:hypothetical protein